MNFKTFFTTIFISILFLPVLQWKFNFINYQKLNEKREKIKFDSLKNTKEFEKYFNDNFGFRDLLIKSKNQIDYSFFKYSKQAYIGDNYWFADKKTITTQKHALDYMDPEVEKKIQNNIIEFNQKLKKQNITLVLLPIPLKYTIYPENFFFSQNQINNSGYLRFRKFFIDNPQIHFVDLYKVFTENKDQQQLYFKTDMHWTDIGAYLAAKETVKYLSQLSKSSSNWQHIPKTEIKKIVGGESESMALLFSIPENAPSLIKNWQECNQEPYPSSSVSNTKLPFCMHYRQGIKCQNKNLLPKTILIGNSFMLYFYSNGFLDNFEELYALHDLTNFQSLLQNIPQGTKYIVWEFFENQIPFQFQQTEWWQQLNKPIKFRDDL